MSRCSPERVATIPQPRQRGWPKTCWAEGIARSSGGIPRHAFKDLATLDGQERIISVTLPVLEDAFVIDILSCGRRSNVSFLLIEGGTPSMSDIWRVSSSLQEEMMNLYGALSYFDFAFI